MNSRYSVIASALWERGNLAVTSKSIGFFVNKRPQKACFSQRPKGRKILIVNFEL